ncbi:putative solute-binding protein [Marinobacter lipolyticus]|uniref:putative solute-binding protein n=1 Tax=Marinobacter lipolyticus TaxID=209639 RepID=UPI003A9449A3
MKVCAATLAVLMGLSVWNPVAASERKEFCVFDVAGAGGFVYRTLQDYQRKAVSSGVSLAMIPYTDEDEAVADFKAGKCDIVAVTDMGVRHFNSFTGSISAIGAVPYYEDLRVLMHILSSPRVDEHMSQDGYQVLGVAPMGAAYLFVNDRSINDADALKGKRVTVFEGHHDARHMLEYIGAVPVDAKISNFARLFNTGQADISYAPAAAYELLEMFKGMGDTGGIIKYPVGQVSVHLVAREGEFDDRFVRRSRKIMSRLYPEAMRIVRQYEDSIPAERWVDISKDAMVGYQEMLREVRIDMQQATHASGMQAASVYDDNMMTILRKVRCYTNPGALECSAEDRE